MRAVSYVRVSTDEQVMSGAGLDAQRVAIVGAVEVRGWRLVGEFVDGAQSGTNLRRRALGDAFGILDAGGADVLVVAKLDRLSRSVADFVAITARAKRHGWSVVALDVDVDTTTPTGELVATIMSAVSQWERRVISVRTSEALQARKAAGARLGRPVQLDESVRRRIASERAAGRSLRAIAAALERDQVPTARGGKWWPATVRAVCESAALDGLAVSSRAGP